MNKEERKQYNRDWYKANPEYRERQKVLKRERRKKIREWLVYYRVQLGGCIDCGELDPDVLEYDHVSSKLFNVSSKPSLSTGALLNEIKSCEIRCANCHRKITARRRRDKV